MTAALFGSNRPKRKKPGRHTIGDIRYGPWAGPSWLSCDLDGERLEAASPDDLVVLWQAHRGMCATEGCERRRPPGASEHCVPHTKTLNAAAAAEEVV